MMASAPHGPAQGLSLPALGFAPMPAVARVLAGFQREQLASFVEVALGLLDLADGDPDREDNGDDELSGDEQDTGWTEYHTRGRHKLAGGMSEPFADHEDDEDDDPDCGLDEGEPNFVAASDGNAGCPISDPGGCQHDGREPDDYDIGIFSDPEARVEHRDRIRATRCDRTTYYGHYSGRQHVEYRLKEPPALNH